MTSKHNYIPCQTNDLIFDARLFVFKFFEADQIAKQTQKQPQQIKADTLMNSQADPKTVEQIYAEFVNQVSEKIVYEIQSDECIDTLKEMDSQEYLIERVRQVVETVHNAEVRQKFISMANELKITQDKRQKVLIENRKSDPSTNQVNYSRAEKTRQMTFGGPGQLEAKNELEECRKQVLELQKKLILQEQESKIDTEQLFQKIRAAESEHSHFKQSSANKLKSLSKVARNWQQKYEKVYQQKCELELSLQSEVDKLSGVKADLAICENELQDKVRYTRRLETQQQDLKDQILQMENEINRLEHDNARLQQNFRKENEEFKILKRSPKVYENQTVEDQRKRMEVQNEKQRYQVGQLAEENKEKDRKILDLEKKLHKLKSEKIQIDDQYHRLRIESQKKTQQLQRESESTVFSLEKQIRLQKQKLGNDKAQLSKDYERQIQDLTQRFEQDITFLQKQLKDRKSAAVQNSQAYERQFKEMKGLLQEKELLYKQSIQEAESKIDKLKTYSAQLESNLMSKSEHSYDILKQKDFKYQKLEEQFEQQKAATKALKLEYDREKVSFSNLRRLEPNCLVSQENDRQVNQARQYQRCISQLKANQTVLSNENSHLAKELKIKSEHCQNMEQKYSQINEKKELLTQKLAQGQKECEKYHRRVIELQNLHQQELRKAQEIFECKLSENKAQMKDHYKGIISQKQGALQSFKESTEAVQFQSTIKALKNALEFERDTNKQKQQKLLDKQKQIEGLKRQAKIQTQRMHDLNLHSKGLQDSLIQEKRKVGVCLQAIQNEKHTWELKFKEFKSEFHLCLCEVLKGLKSQLRDIKGDLKNMSQKFEEEIEDITRKVYSETIRIEDVHSQSKKQITKYYENEVLPKLQIDLKELKFKFDKELKEKTIEMMTIVAEKEHQIRSLCEKQKQLSIKLENVTRQYEENASELQDISEVNAKVKEQKETLAARLGQEEKKSNILANDLKYHKELNEQLSRQLRQTEHKSNEMLEKCREKYLQENEKLFAKYEKEFQKLIGMNIAVNKGNSLQKCLSSQNLIPTKQHCVDESSKLSKLESIKSEIMAQKKKIESLQRAKSKGTKNQASKDFSSFGKTKLKNIVK